MRYPLTSVRITATTNGKNKLGSGKKDMLFTVGGNGDYEVMGSVQKLLKKVKTGVSKVNHQCSGYTAKGSKMMSYRQLNPMLVATLKYYYV